MFYIVLFILGVVISRIGRHCLIYEIADVAIRGKRNTLVHLINLLVRYGGLLLMLISVLGFFKVLLFIKLLKYGFGVLCVISILRGTGMVLADHKPFRGILLVVVSIWTLHLLGILSLRF